jgi:hypothetical protein
MLIASTTAGLPAAEFEQAGADQIKAGATNSIR